MQTTVDLDDIAAAHRLADTGRKRGNVVVRITHTHHPEGASVMIKAHALTRRSSDATAVDAAYHAGAGWPGPSHSPSARRSSAPEPADCALMGAAWAINLTVVERQICKRPRRGTPGAPGHVPLP